MPESHQLKVCRLEGLSGKGPIKGERRPGQSEVLPREEHLGGGGEASSFMIETQQNKGRQILGTSMEVSVEWWEGARLSHHC